MLCSRNRPVAREIVVLELGQRILKGANSMYKTKVKLSITCTRLRETLIRLVRTTARSTFQEQQLVLQVLLLRPTQKHLRKTQTTQRI